MLPDGLLCAGLFHKFFSFWWLLSGIAPARSLCLQRLGTLSSSVQAEAALLLCWPVCPSWSGCCLALVVITVGTVKGAAQQKGRTGFHSRKPSGDAGEAGISCLGSDCHRRAVLVRYGSALLSSGRGLSLGTLGSVPSRWGLG